MKLMIKSAFVAMVVAGLCFSPFVAAEESTEDLKAQIQMLQERVAELESQQERFNNPSENDDFFRGRARWDPFEEMRLMQDEMNKMFQDSFMRSGSFFSDPMNSSAMNFQDDFEVVETSDGYEVHVNVSGLDKDKMDIKIDTHSITVSGEYSMDERNESVNGFYQAQRFGAFLKTIPLPLDADTEQVKTEKEGDSLVIRLPRKKT